MRYQNVCLDKFVCTLPEEVVTTDELETRLSLLYERLKLPKGRLAMMTGIDARRVWPVGTSIGQQSARTVQKLIAETEIDPQMVGALLHGSVCRDYLEPATVCSVHQMIGNLTDEQPAVKLPENCVLFDISNACLGLASGIIMVANMIELGQIQAGIVVGTESSRALMEATIRHLNSDTTLTRQSVKSAFASLTIGSGSAAVLLTHRNISPTRRRLRGATLHTKTQFCHLCQSDTDQSGGDTMNPLMTTDSEQLMIEGVRAADTCWRRFLAEMEWSSADVNKAFCHQVGDRHQKLLFDTLGLNLAIHFPTLRWLGNTGSVAFPTAAALGEEDGFVSAGDNVALLGIGSGINVAMLAWQWPAAECQ